MLGFFVDLSRNPPMAKLAQKSLRREASALEPARHRATTDRRLRILEPLTKDPTVTRIRQTLAATLVSSDIHPPAGFVQFQIARLSEAMIVARTMTKRAMCAMDRLIRLTGELDPYHGLGKPTVSLPAEGSPPRRPAGSRRELPAPTKAKAKTFLAAKH
jgi:hypothetical protein